MIKHIALSMYFEIFGCQTVLIGEIAETFPFSDISTSQAFDHLIGHCINSYRIVQFPVGILKILR